MNSIEDLIDLAEMSVRYVPRGTVYHETLTEPLVKTPDISYLLDQLSENEFLGHMKTKRIIRYSHRADYTVVEMPVSVTRSVCPLPLVALKS